MVLLPLVADRVDLPIIAAGGMCDARPPPPPWCSAPRACRWAPGCWPAVESAVHANFKNAIVAANDAGTVLLDMPGNPTMRVLRTGLAARVAAHDPAPSCWARSRSSTSTATSTPASPTPARCRHASPICCGRHRLSRKRGQRSKMHCATADLDLEITVLIRSLVCEERLQRRGTLVGQHSPAHLGPVRQPPVADHVPQRPDRPRLRLPRAEHQPRPAPSPARLRTSCTARPSPPAWCLPAASRRPADAAARIARISACAVGSPSSSRMLAARASSVPSAATITAPTGTSRRPCAPAASSAALISSSSGVTDRGGRARPTARRRTPSPARSGPVVRRRTGPTRRG